MAIIKTTIVTVCFWAGIGLGVLASGAAEGLMGLGITTGGVGVTAGGLPSGGGEVEFREVGGANLLVKSPMVGVGGGVIEGVSILAETGGGTINGLIAGAGGIPT